jgi:hypothetical protein
LYASPTHLVCIKVILEGRQPTFGVEDKAAAIPAGQRLNAVVERQVQRVEGRFALDLGVPKHRHGVTIILALELEPPLFPALDDLALLEEEAELPRERAGLAFVDSGTPACGSGRTFTIVWGCIW